MRYIKQEFSTSCGIACVAMLAEKNLRKIPLKERHQKVFDKAKKEISNRKFSKTDSYTKRSEIRNLLKVFNVSWQGHFNLIKQDEQSQKKFWNNLKGTNLVAVKYHIRDDEEYWHWIIAIQSKNKLKIFDPNPKKRVSCIDFTKNHLPDQRSYKNAKWFLKIV